MPNPIHAPIEPRAAVADAVICPKGFLAAGMACGIKPTGMHDLALVLCSPGREANAAAMFTRNRVKAAPVVLSRQNLDQTRGRVRALLINSGCANAATGEEGMRRAQRVLDALATHISSPPERILMNSTGVIGEQLPDESIIKAVPRLIASCSAEGLAEAARAIMTTDTKPKIAQHVINEPSGASGGGGGRTCRVVGIAKGSGMIHPNMATMIAVILTDAQVEPQALDSMLRSAVDRSFHRISVDGDTSTNDSVFLLASGAAGSFAHESLAAAVNNVACELAEMIVRDGEGASKLIRVIATGAATPADALLAARTVATSLLVRTSIAGGDPNWGRILMAVGRSGAEFDPQRLAIRVNRLEIFANGRPSPVAPDEMQAAYDSSEIELALDLHRGDCEDRFLTCDLTEQYVRINAEYRS